MKYLENIPTLTTEKIECDFQEICNALKDQNSDLIKSLFPTSEKSSLADSLLEKTVAAVKQVHESEVDAAKKFGFNHLAKEIIRFLLKRSITPTQFTLDSVKDHPLILNMLLYRAEYHLHTERRCSFVEFFNGESYDVRVVIGEGQGGIVKVAISPSGNSMAVKYLNEMPTKYSLKTKQELLEIQAFNTIRIHGHESCYLFRIMNDTGEPQYRLVMNYITDHTLSDELKMGTSPLFLYYLTAKGLQRFHDQGWAHRDVHEDNIIIKRKFIKIEIRKYSFPYNRLLLEIQFIDLANAKPLQIPADEKQRDMKSERAIHTDIDQFHELIQKLHPELLRDSELSQQFTQILAEQIPQQANFSLIIHALEKMIQVNFSSLIQTALLAPLPSKSQDISKNLVALAMRDDFLGYLIEIKNLFLTRKITFKQVLKLTDAYPLHFNKKAMENKQTDILITILFLLFDNHSFVKQLNEKFNYGGKITILESLISEGQHNTLTQFFTESTQGPHLEMIRYSLLFYAVTRDRATIIPALLTNAQNVNQFNTYWGYNLLNAAVIVNSPSAVQILLRAKADPNQFDQRGFTALMHAFQYQDSKQKLAAMDAFSTSANMDWWQQFSGIFFDDYWAGIFRELSDKKAAMDLRQERLRKRAPSIYHLIIKRLIKCMNGEHPNYDSKIELEDAEKELLFGKMAFNYFIDHAVDARFEFNDLMELNNHVRQLTFNHPELFQLVTHGIAHLHISYKQRKKHVDDEKNIQAIVSSLHEAKADVNLEAQTDKTSSHKKLPFSYKGLTVFQIAANHKTLDLAVAVFGDAPSSPTKSSTDLVSTDPQP